MKEKSLWLLTFAAWFATFLLLGVMILLKNKLSIWADLNSNEKIRFIVAAVYLLILTLLAWHYRLKRIRIVGVVEALLMFGISGMVLYEIGKGILIPPGPDNAGAGIIAATNVLFVLMGGIAAVCGVVASRHVIAK
jgi:hypothetical protein